ncbi:MAG: cyclic nucleotide-binding domain-containing protein [Alphaproteobacteria bacterium]|nr:cyclic nucleotide-binding domain-containing protein [Alphaproteobacteria bacterium]
MLGIVGAHIPEAAGLLGVILYVGAYAALQSGLLRSNGYSYAAANLVAASLVLLSLSIDFNLSAAISQIVWIVISVFGLVRMAVLERRACLTEEEQAFMAAKFPTMNRAMARKFLNGGEWYDAKAGTLLVTEGERLGGLIYLASGEAEITLRGRPIAQCLPGSFIGEMSCFDGSPANATVSLRQPSRYFVIRTEALQRLCARDLDMRRTVENGVGTDTRHKLIATDLRLREAAGA